MKNETVRKTIKELVQYALLALVIVVPIRMFIAQPFIVSGASMDSTFRDGQYLIIDEISYRFSDVNRGDVIVFKYPLMPSKYFIKRVIGLPGETISINGNTTTITKTDGTTFALPEPYTHSQTLQVLTTKLASDEYFVMGDNREVSLDSRSWGPLKRNLILGQPIVRLLPVSTLGTYPGSLQSFGTSK
jgi:signal peptidase I